MPEAPTKVRPGQRGVASFLRQAKPSDSVIPKPDNKTANLDLTTLRTKTTTWDTLNAYAKVSPDISASVDAYIRTAVTSNYVAIARAADGTVDREATKVLQQMLSRVDVASDYRQGFSSQMSVRALAESWARELRLYGACSGELVLDKARQPSRIQPVSVTQIRFYPRKDGSGVYPVQLVGGDEVSLDFPTYFYVSLDQDLTDAYASAPMEPALQPLLMSHEFLNDLRKVVKRAIHPRFQVVIEEEMLKKQVPPELYGDPTKIREWINSVVEGIAQSINGLQPEDALVHLDSMTMGYMTGGSTSLNQEYTALQGIINSKVSTGTKAMPSILGQGSGTQNVASTESMLFVKSAEGAVQFKLNEMFTKVLTLAMRLMGYEVTVDFRFDKVNLRPDDELEAFKAQKQSRILDLLSLGFITDEQAAIELTGYIQPEGAPKLSGTMFRQGAGTTNSSGNLYSNSSQGGAGGGALNQGLKPEVSSKKRGGKG